MKSGTARESENSTLCLKYGDERQAAGTESEKCQHFLQGPFGHAVNRAQTPCPPGATHITVQAAFRTHKQNGILRQ